MNDEKSKTPALMTLAPRYLAGRGGGPLLAERLKRRADAPPSAWASLEFSTEASAGTSAADGLEAGVNLADLDREARDALFGSLASDLARAGLSFDSRVVTFSGKDAPILMNPPGEGDDKKGLSLVKSMVYVLEARAGAKIYYGRRRDLGEEEFLSSLRKGPDPGLLQEFKAEPGQVFSAPAGMPLAMDKGVLAVICGAHHQGAPLADAGIEKVGVKGIITVSIAPSRLFINGLGYVDGPNFVTLLFAAESFAGARLDLRGEYEESLRPGSSFTLLTGLGGRALVTAAGEVEPIEEGRTALVSAASDGFRVNPEPPGASFFMVRLIEPEADLEAPLTEKGFTRREIESLYGFFGKVPKKI